MEDGEKDTVGQGTGSKAMDRRGRGPGSWRVECPRGSFRRGHRGPGVRCEAVCCGNTRDVFAFENQGDYDRALAVTYAVLLAFKIKMKKGLFLAILEQN